MPGRASARSCRLPSNSRAPSRLPLESNTGKRVLSARIVTKYSDNTSGRSGKIGDAAKVLRSALVQNVPLVT